jgi:hypothetical protein
MSNQNMLSPSGLTSPVGKSLLTAFSKTIDRMEARIREKSKPADHCDRQDEILRKFNINLDSHLAHKSDTKQEVINVHTNKVFQSEYQGRSEAAYFNEHRRICGRAAFHMVFTDPQNEGEEMPEDSSKSMQEPSRIHATSDLGRFEDSECSSDEDLDTSFSNPASHTQSNSFIAPLDATSDSEQVSMLSIIDKSPSHQMNINIDLIVSGRDDVQPKDSEETSPTGASITGVRTSKPDAPSSSSRSLTGEKPRPKPMKFNAGKNYSNQTAAEGREYSLSIIGMPRPAGIDKVTARRFYIESCEQQKITPHISHISKFEGNSFTYSSIKDVTTNLKGIGEKRLLALSRFIQDRLNEDGSQLILRECLIGIVVGTIHSAQTHLFLGNDGCKILQRLVVESKIPCKIRALDLSENCFNSIGIRTLSPILTLSSLMRLTLSKLNLGDSGICSLIDVMCVTFALTTAGTVGRFEGDVSPFPQSPKLSPKSPKFSSSHTLQHVTFLDLSHNGVRTQGANAIARFIQVSTSLIHLELGWNAIGASGSSSIEKSLQKNSILTYLGLSWNGLDESGGVSMASLIGTSKFLQELDLSNNRINAIATCLISSALRQNTSLKNLDLAGNLIGKAGCKSLLRVMRWQQMHRCAKVLEQKEAAKLATKKAEFSLNSDETECHEINQWPAASINLDACIFEDQVTLDLELHNCNGFHSLNLKNFKDRAKLAEL